MSPPPNYDILLWQLSSIDKNWWYRRSRREWEWRQFPRLYVQLRLWTKALKFSQSLEQVTDTSGGEPLASVGIVAGMRGYVTARRLRSHVSREIPGCYVGARSISVALPSTTNEIGWATRGAGGQPGWAWHRSRSLLPASAGVPSVYFLSELISIYVRRRIMRKPSRTEWSFFLLNF